MSRKHTAVDAYHRRKITAARRQAKALERLDHALAYVDDLDFEELEPFIIDGKFNSLYGSSNV